MTCPHRFVLTRFILIVFLGAGLGCARQEPADVAEDPAAPVLDIPTRFPSVPRLVAIGDLHGDLRAARSALKLAGAIDDTDRWIGGDLTIVQLGDILDRGDDAMEILDLLDRLGEQAKVVGGEVHLLNGNHELMNVKLDMRYVSIGGFTDFLSHMESDPATATAQDVVDGVHERILGYRPGGPMALRLAERNVVSIIGDSVFVHGGVVPRLADYGVERLNQETREWIRGDLPCPPEILLAHDGPVWSRDFSRRSDDEACRLLRASLESLGAQRMVVGHTVQNDGISSACDGRVWRVDVGMADHYGGSPAVLELSGGKVRTLDSQP